MGKTKKPHFKIHNRFQKRTWLYSELLTPDILADVCKRVTGSVEYTSEFVNAVNVGRLATLEYHKTIAYISFSETGNEGRNSSFQSFPSALVRYYKDPRPQKRICFYFLPSGNCETRYFSFMYRLMATAGVELLNAEDVLANTVYPFTTIDDIIAARESNRSRNRSNNSTYLTRSSRSVAQLYGKTYGASKKETTLLCVALSRVTPSIELYQISEGNLTELPKPDLEVIQMLGKVRIIPTDRTMERNEFVKYDSLRSPTFTYNLLRKLGPKRCALCECEIPELVQGAHIWSVADIKRDHSLSIDHKVEYATDGDNGLWLCENHHKMLDEDLLRISSSGRIAVISSLEDKSKEYISKTTTIVQLTPELFTEGFATYLQRRYPP